MSTLMSDAEILKNLGLIADDETLLRRVACYLRKLVKERNDATLMTEEEFFARIDEAGKGESHEMLPGENLTDFLKRRGYVV